LYGYSRLAQINDETSVYFLGDASGSVRQARILRPRTLLVSGVVDPEAEIELMNSYAPYGDLISSEVSFDTSYGYTGELTDSSGRFISKDTWAGDYQNPITLGELFFKSSFLHVRRIL